jgi:hypothetical protein
MPSLAGTQYISKDGNLTVQYGNQCSTTKPTGSYRVRNGASGNLTSLDCSGMGGDISSQICGWGWPRALLLLLKARFDVCVAP